MKRRAIGAALSAFVAAACTTNRPASDPPENPPAPPDLSAAARSAGLADREWHLVSFGDRPAALGAGARPATIRFDLADGRAGGFAGCNSYSASYRLQGDSLGFGPAVSTRMACDAGMDLERDLLAALESVRRFALADSMLVLHGDAGVVMRFR